MMMPPELMELYMLYQQELETRNDNEKKIISDANVMIRVKASVDEYLITACMGLID